MSKEDHPFLKKFFKRLCRCDIEIQRAGKHESCQDAGSGTVQALCLRSIMQPVVSVVMMFKNKDGMVQAILGALWELMQCKQARPGELSRSEEALTEPGTLDGVSVWTDLG